MAEPLSWGVPPLPEQVRIAALLRDVTGLVLAQENSGPELEDALRSLEAVRAVLALSAPPETVPRVGRHLDADGRVYIDHCLDIHRWNPMFPAYGIDVVDGSRARGTVTFPLCYEGPAGNVNGGVLGVFFDAVVQHHNCAVGQSGATRDLTITYRRPTPLDVELTFEIDRTVEERSILSEVRVLHKDRVVCSATTRAAIFENIPNPPVSARR